MTDAEYIKAQYHPEFQNNLFHPESNQGVKESTTPLPTTEKGYSDSTLEEIFSGDIYFSQIDITQIPDEIVKRKIPTFISPVFKKELRREMIIFRILKEKNLESQLVKNLTIVSKILNKLLDIHRFPAWIHNLPELLEAKNFEGNTLAHISKHSQPWKLYSKNTGSIKNREGQTPLHRYIHKYDLATLIESIPIELFNPQHLDIKDSGGHTPIDYESWRSALEIGGVSQTTWERFSSDTLVELKEIFKNNESLTHRAGERIEHAIKISKDLETKRTQINHALNHHITLPDDRT
jgi:hypothetical protein